MTLILLGFNGGYDFPKPPSVVVPDLKNQLGWVKARSMPRIPLATPSTNTNNKLNPRNTNTDIQLQLPSPQPFTHIPAVRTVCSTNRLQFAVTFMTHHELSEAIEHWLNAVINHQPLGLDSTSPILGDYNYDFCPRPSDQKRNYMPTTPPPSGRAGSSPNKRKKWSSPDEEPVGDTHSPPSTKGQDPEQLPIAHTTHIHILPQYQAPVPIRSLGQTPSLAPSNPPSVASRDPYYVASPTPSDVLSKKGRPKSPVRSSNSLWTLEIPVINTSLSDDPTDQLPSDVQDLFSRITDITTDRLGFIPGEVRESVQRLVYKPRDHWFRPVVEAHDSIDAATDLVQTRKPRTMAERAVSELDTLRDIESDAKQCHKDGRSEPAWNTLVHAPLLRHALFYHPTVQMEHATTAKIATPFVPTTGGRGGGSVIESKMIDFALVLWLNNGELRPEPGAGAESGDARLVSAIAERVWQQPADRQTINQTMYQPLQFAPIGVSIETKIASSAVDGMLQLSVWAAAWYKRMKQFLPPDAAEKAPSVVTLPLLYVTGHVWNLSFACDRGDRIEIIGEHSIGDTRTLLGLYTIVAVIQELGHWMSTTYRNWLEEVFL